MANQTIAITSTGQKFDGTVNISGFTIAPTNATWAIVLKDYAGNTILSLNTNSPASSFDSITVTGIECTTYTAAPIYLQLN